MKYFNTKRNHSLIGTMNIDPNMTLNGKTPNEVYYHRHAANAKPRIETRSKVKLQLPVPHRECVLPVEPEQK
jgi:hypothetical protein